MIDIEIQSNHQKKIKHINNFIVRYINNNCKWSSSSFVNFFLNMEEL